MFKKDDKKNSRFNLDLHSDTKKDIFSVFLVVFGLVSILGFFRIAGIFGELMTKSFYLGFGIAAFLIPLLFILIGVLLFKSDEENSFSSSIWGLIFFAISFLGVIQVISEKVLWINFRQNYVSYGGGYLGFAFSYPFMKLFGFWASSIILIAFLIVSFLVIFNVPLKTLLGLNKEKSYKVLENVKKNDAKGIEKDADSEKSFLGGLAARILPKPKFSIKNIKNDNIKESDENKKEVKIKEDSSFMYPTLDLLEEGKSQPSVGDITVNSNIIKRTLESFGIEVEMSGVNIGPTVTQYTLKPSMGVKLSNITSLNNDLALALAAHPIRIEAPIPGQSLVGIEIPNRNPALVKLRQILESEEYMNRKSSISICLGKDVAGIPMIDYLDKMPHLLIAGSTGSGKTVVLNSIIISLLYQNSPNNLKFILIDPKRVEFTAYNDVPHLLAPVIVEAQKAINSLKWAVHEMERRFKVLQEAKSRDLHSYHEKYEAEIAKNPNSEWEKLPFITIVIDELADLMASNGREMEALIVRLAQMARAVGIHMILATQRPSVEVITGLIKANITCRIACQVASQIDSRTILDMAGAEKLLGRGDMLFVSSTSKMKRVQGAYISEKEVHKVSQFLIKNNKQNEENDYDIKITEGKNAITAENNIFSNNGGMIDDDLYDQAKEVIISAGKASASLLQRRLRVGYARAARLIDLLEEQGVIGPADGARPREVIEVSKEDGDTLM